MTVEIVPARHKHIGRIARYIRDIDRRECEAMGRTPKRSMRVGLATSTQALTALVDGQPEAMFGVVTESALTREGTPWFLGTEKVYDHGRALLLMGPHILSEFGDSMSCLSNLVSSENTKAIRLLRRWGFKIEQETVEVRGVPFHRFAMELA